MANQMRLPRRKNRTRDRFSRRAFNQKLASQRPLRALVEGKRLSAILTQRPVRLADARFVCRPLTPTTLIQRMSDL